MGGGKGQGGTAAASASGVRGAAGPGRVCVGAVAGAHGVRGAVRIRSFTADAADVGAYGPVADESGGRSFDIRVRETRKGAAIAELSGVRDREAAEALRGERLYVPREALPPAEEGEFYHADLLGLSAFLADGGEAGTVAAIVPAGEVEVLEIDPGSGAERVLVPFTAEAVPEVDIAGGRIVVDPPAMPAGGGPDGTGG